MCLASAEFTECLSDSLTLDASLKKHIELATASCDPPDLLALLKDDHTILKAHGLDLGGSLVDLLCLLLSDALDVQHLFLGAKSLLKFH